MREKLRVVIVDDEARARRVLENLLNRYCKNVEILASFSNVSDAIPEIMTLKPDAIFLDIEMPEFSGFELLNRLGEFSCDIVFITAYNKYAVKAFEVSAIDYLLKPVSIDRLESAVEKLRKSIDNSKIEQRIKVLEKNLEDNENKRLVLNSRDGIDFVKQNEITHINADGSYCQIFLVSEKRIVVSKKLKFIEERLLEGDQFFRCHRSHIVNLNWVKRYVPGAGTLLMENGLELKVAREKKEMCSSLLQGRQ